MFLRMVAVLWTKLDGQYSTPYPTLTRNISGREIHGCEVNNVPIKTCDTICEHSLVTKRHGTFIGVCRKMVGNATRDSVCYGVLGVCCNTGRAHTLMGEMSNSANNADVCPYVLQ